ncbi:AgmX/PglI C-terminal domain-containing protein [Nannocystis radixulma]|uniref:AgmX/PglI C-terminal domain-containing protein n=1 Tax=Nannocystis radixulma TaxID=2995305 RepID=A0ABT5BHE4_9BACT|nr:AgmX/PglI C-terminal domain-containing protein [Nannocystis radixulma]MDC0672833.1 AgmX/PglI C-terminal domain-containing protein [Nannocystis radixulma]
MPRHLVPLALVSALLGGAACDRPDVPANAGTEAAPADPWTSAAVASLGERAALVAIVRLQAWPAVSAHLAPLVQQLGAAAPRRAALLLAGDLSVFLHMLFGPASPAGPGLTGLDPARPVVLALDEPGLLAPPGLLAAELAHSPGSLPGLRHELVLPALDPAGLADGLARWFDALGRQEPALAASSGARAWVTGPGDLVAVVAEADAVRVVGLQRALAPAGTPIESVPPALRGELLRPAAPPSTSSWPADAGREPLTVLLRPRVLPALLQWQRAREAADALARTTFVEGAQLRRAALAGLLRCEQALGDGVVDLESWLLAVADDPHGLRLRLAAELTATGAQALGPPSTRDPLALRVPAIASAVVRLDLADDPSGAPPIDTHPAEVLKRCADVLPAMSLGTPLSALRRAMLPPDVTAHLAITSIDADGPRAALDLDLAATTDISRFQSIARQIVTGLAREFELHAVPAGDRQRVLVGAGVDPRAVFADTTVPAGLVAARVDLAAVVPLLRAVAPDLATALSPHRRAAFDLARINSHLRGELVLGDGEPAATPLAAAAEQPAPPPAPPSSGVVCARSFVEQATDLLERARPPAVAPSGPALDQKLAALEPNLHCIESDPATAAHAPALRRMLPLALADLLADEFRPGEGARVLAGACEAGDPIACRRRVELAALPDVALPELHSNCPAHQDRYAHRLALAGDRLALDDRPLADAAELTQRLAALAEEKDASLALAIDATTPFAALRPLLAALAPQRHLRLGILAGHDRNSTGTYAIPTLPPQIAASPPASSQQAPLSPNLRVGALVLAGDGSALRMRTGTTALGLYPYLHATTIESDARERPDNGLPPLVTATEATPWSTVAVALAGTCSPHVLAEAADVQAQLGRPDRSVSILWDPHGPKPLSVTPKVRGPNNINSGLFKAKPRVEYCYGRALADQPALAGKVVVEFAVSAAGKLGLVTIASSTLKHPEVERCIVDAIERYTSWSSADSDAVIRWQFDFTRR